jgi:hypothetical protein
MNASVKRGRILAGELHWTLRKGSAARSGHIDEWH